MGSFFLFCFFRQPAPMVFRLEVTTSTSPALMEWYVCSTLKTFTTLPPYPNPIISGWTSQLDRTLGTLLYCVACQVGWVFATVHTILKIEFLPRKSMKMINIPKYNFENKIDPYPLYILALSFLFLQIWYTTNSFIVGLI